MICCGLNLEYWDYVKDDIERALKADFGRMTIEDLRSSIENKTAQLWAIHDGAIHAVMTTEIINYPQLNAVRIMTVTGKDSEQWLDLLIDTISRWGAENGADVVEFVGRKGWEKVLTKRGFGETQIFMTKPIKRCEAPRGKK